MDPSDTPREALAATLRQLRWLLTGYRLSGLEHWQPREPEASPEPIAEAGPIAEASAEPVTGAASEPIAEAEEPFTEAVSPKLDPEAALAAVSEELKECRRCRLSSGRTQVVFGDGSPTARLVFVGEGPGFDEDREGRPFVGRAGKLLDKMIRALGMSRPEVYICNVVKCRPPNNRTPNPDEIEVCGGFLVRQLEILKPAVICALGACAAQTLLGSTSAVSKLRGRVHSWRGIPLICTYHPAYLLRTPAQKAATWQDLLEVARILQHH